MNAPGVVQRTGASPAPHFGTAPTTEGELVVLESCHSTWVFDFGRMRFRRILKERRTAPTAWVPFYGLELDDGRESFVILLNPSGSRLMRSWRHLAHCAQCGGEATTELSLDELRSSISVGSPAVAR